MLVQAEHTLNFKLRIKLYFPAPKTPSKGQPATADYQTNSYMPPGIAAQLSEITAIGTNVAVRVGIGDETPNQVHQWAYHEMTIQLVHKRHTILTQVRG